jgi:glutamate-1-semialdehyde 2,1-aminomutase
MSMMSEQLFERAKRVSPGGVQSPVRAFKGLGRAPLFFKSAQGARLKAVDGAEYIDFCQSFGPLILGHRDPDVSAKVEEMIGKAWTFGACEPYSLELAEWIVQNVEHVESLRFVSSGTEAVMSACRVARGATGRHKIIKFEGCYHGHVDSLLVKAGSGLAGTAASDSAGVSENVASETIVLPLGDREAVVQAFEKHRGEIAAVIIEPLPANFGLLKPNCNDLRFLRKITEQEGSLLIFDEVISGFRVALGGMAEISEVTPDLVTYGKVIGGGFPVGCYGGKKDYMDLVAPQGPVYQAGTLSGNPVGMVAGLATLIKGPKRTCHFHHGGEGF